MPCWIKGLLLALGLGMLLPLAAVQAQVPEAYRQGESHFEDVVRDVKRLGVAPEEGRDTACQNSVYAANPCPEIVQAYNAFVEEHDLPRSRQTAAMLRAYIESDFRSADRLYATAKGFSLPGDAQAGTGLGGSVNALGVRRRDTLESTCSNDLMSAKPCPATLRAWNTFAEQHGLELNRQTARMFDSYIAGRTEEADEIHARVQQEKRQAPANRIHADVRSYNVRRRSGLEAGSCENNYYANTPCLEAVRAWRQFAEQHGLELNRRTADLFEAYVEDNPVQGDKLYAAEKGISVAQLLKDRGHDIVVPSDTENPLYVPIFPAGSGR
ncbi:MAG: hypothetical protein AAFY02_16740 [Pseudomonadota bacterium]